MRYVGAVSSGSCLPVITHGADIIRTISDSVIKASQSGRDSFNFRDRDEVLVYGDGVFKDPLCGIWELADPVASPGYTDGLEGMPKEIKFKYVADNVGGKDPAGSAQDAIATKKILDRLGHSTFGTRPRRFTDLIGSLCDLTFGSGDKGTPVIHIQGYFDSYLDD